MSAVWTMPNVGLFDSCTVFCTTQPSMNVPNVGERKQLERSAWGIPLWGTLPENSLSRLFHPPPLEAWFCASALIIILTETGQRSCTLLQSLTHSIIIIITRCLCFSFRSLPISQSLSLSHSLIQRSWQFEFNVLPWKDTHKHWLQVYIWSIEIQEMDYNVLLRKII